MTQELKLSEFHKWKNEGLHGSVSVDSLLPTITLGFSLKEIRIEERCFHVRCLLLIYLQVLIYSDLILIQYYNWISVTIIEIFPFVSGIHSDLIPLFDPSLSPRNSILIGRKRCQQVDFAVRGAVWIEMIDNICFKYLYNFIGWNIFW
jgi:hypothetical protein